MERTGGAAPVGKEGREVEDGGEQFGARHDVGDCLHMHRVRRKQQPTPPAVPSQWFGIGPNLGSLLWRVRCMLSEAWLERQDHDLAVLLLRWPAPESKACNPKCNVRRRKTSFVFGGEMQKALQVGIATGQHALDLELAR